MALQLNKKELDKSSVMPLLKSESKSNPEKYIGLVNNFMLNLSNTINQAKGLLGNYHSLKEKLTGNSQQKANYEHVQPAQRGIPVQVPKPEPVQKPKEAIKVEDKESKQDNLSKAEALFNEVHNMVKPYLSFANGVSAGTVIQMALQPENKKKIIQKIAERLESL